MSAARSPNQKKKDSGNVVYGLGPVREAIRSDPASVERVIVEEGRRKGAAAAVTASARSAGLRVDRVPRRALMEMLPAGANHQGLAAVISAARYADEESVLKRLEESDDALCVVLDGVEDPHNLGAVIRSAECAGVTDIFIPERRSVGLNATAAKTSAGAVQHVNVVRVTNINRLIDGLKEAGFWVVGTAADAEADHYSWDWSRKCALVLGGEGSGLSRLTSEKCDVLVRIPMCGRIESLNVSVAAGVVLFEAVRQRSKG